MEGKGEGWAIWIKDYDDDDDDDGRTTLAAAKPAKPLRKTRVGMAVHVATGALAPSMLKPRGRKYLFAPQ